MPTSPSAPDGNRLVLDNLPGLFAMIGEDGRLLQWNRNLELATGYGAGDLAGRPVLDLCAEEDRKMLGAKIAEVFADRAVTEEATIVAITEEATIVAKDGKRRPYILSAHRLSTPEGARLVCTGIPVSARRRAEIQLAHASRLATLGEMAASLTHEINQPLNVISLSAQSAALGVLRGTDESRDTARRLNVILSQIDRINAIIRHMTALSRRDVGKSTPFGYGEVMAAAVELMRPQLAAEGIVLDHRPPPPGYGGNAAGHPGHTVLGHPVRLEQVIINLLANAGHAVAERCRDLPAEYHDGRVSLRYREESGAVEIIVADNGTGIPEDALPLLFEPFFTTKPPGKGTGLGLSVSRSIVEEMGGTLTAHNTGCGAEFTIRLPLQPGATADACAVLAATPADGRPLAVLVVDDEEDGRETTADCLAHLGCTVTAVGGGAEALAACAGHAFDLVLTDLRMPGMDGLELLHRLRAAHPGLPVAVMSGHLHGPLVDPILADPVMADGVTGLLRKPLSVPDLSALVERIRKG